MKTKNEAIQSEIPDFVEEHDIFGLIKSKRIEVHKTSKSTINIAVRKPKVKYASFGDRLNAFLIDIIILFTFLSVLDMLTRTLLPSLNGIQIQNFAVILGISLIWILYNGIFESSKYQATIGELILKIKVTDIHGKRLNIRKALLRNIVAVVALLPLGFGIWSIAIDSRKQGWHDKWLDCYVIKS